MLSGVRWGTFNQVVQQATRLLVQIVLTRLLAPEAFGLLTLAFVIVNLGALFTGLGFTQALIQRREVSQHLVDAVLVGSAMLGMVLAGATFLSAGPLATVLGEPEVAPVLRACSVIFLFQGVEGAPNGMLRRALLFRPFVLSSTIAAVLGGAVGIGLAFAGFGVWALVGFAVSEAVIATSLAWVFAIRAGVWRPGWTFDLSPLRSVLGYSTAVTGNRLLFYGSRNVDNLIVGRVLGATALGFYGLAYRLMLFPIQRVTDVVSSVALPAFATLQDDRIRLASGYLRAVRALSAVVIPVTVGIALTAPDLVPVLFGEQWRPAVAPLRVLAVSGPALAMVRLNGNLFEGMGRAGVSLAISAVTLALLVPAFLVGVRHGVMGVAIAYTATAYLGLLPAAHMVARTAGIGVGQQIRNVLPVLAGATVMVGAVLLSVPVLPANELVRLVGTTVVGAGVYLATVALLAQDLLGDVVRVVRVGRKAP